MDPRTSIFASTNVLVTYFKTEIFPVELKWHFPHIRNYLPSRIIKMT